MLEPNKLKKVKFLSVSPLATIQAPQIILALGGLIIKSINKKRSGAVTTLSHSRSPIKKGTLCLGLELARSEVLDKALVIDHDFSFPEVRAFKEFFFTSALEEIVNICGLRVNQRFQPSKRFSFREVGVSAVP